MLKVLAAVFLMALVTYIPRVLPIAIFRKEIKSVWLKSFLHYVPFAVLGVLTFPDILNSTGSFIPSLAGTVAALFLAYREKSLIIVATGAMITAWFVNAMALSINWL
jgi:branched-subunit amino acid transport protein